MLLKKQTVWLLTMLSLVVVLSVYYITSPEQQQNELTAMEEKEAKQEIADGKEANISEKDAKIITNAAGDEVFETLRIQREDERSQMKAELTKIVASTDLPVEKRNEAKEQMDALNDIARKELLLETLIKGTMNYKDVLVRADGEQVNITVKTEKQSKADANKIIQTVRSEIGPLHAVVEFETAK